MNTRTATSSLGTLLEILKGHQTEQKLCMRIPDEQVLDAGMQSQPFVEDGAYFEIRLSEMFIRDARVFVRSFVPLTVAVTEFIYDGSRAIVPFIVGKQVLKSVEQYVSGENVEYKNTSIAGPIPYLGGKVALFVGLYRTQVNDISRKLFGLLGGILSRFDATGLSRYLDIAGPLGAGLGDLLGMKEVEFLLGKRDEFDSAAGNPSSFRPGYLVYMNGTVGQLEGQTLYVKDDSLHIGSSNTNYERFSACDYCLVKIERIVERGDYTALPFHKLWIGAKDLIWQDQVEKAKSAFIALVQELARSADLTTTHRYLLMQAYKANFEVELQTRRIATTFSREGSPEVVRGSTRQLKNAARDAIQAAAYCAKTAQLSEPQKILGELSKKLDEIPDLDGRTRETTLTNEMLKFQLRKLQEINPVSKPNINDLASVLTKAAFQPEGSTN
jgi:hypothetical protein